MVEVERTEEIREQRRTVLRELNPDPVRGAAVGIRKERCVFSALGR